MSHMCSLSHATYKRFKCVQRVMTHTNESYVCSMSHATYKRLMCVQRVMTHTNESFHIYTTYMCATSHDTHE